MLSNVTTALSIIKLKFISIKLVKLLPQQEQNFKEVSKRKMKIIFIYQAN